MNDQPKSIWRREILPELFIFRWSRWFFGWLVSWRGVRRILIVLAWTATIIGLFYAEENWRGRRAWNKYRQELEARGEQLDLKALIPKPIPEDQNFAATPFVQSWFVRTNDIWNDNYSKAAEMLDTSKKDPSRRHFADLAGLERAFTYMASGKFDADLTRKRGHLEPTDMRRFKPGDEALDSRAKAAPAVLEGLRDREAVLEELRGASRRPYARYPVVYDLENPWGILLPHLASVKASCVRLDLRACAELAAGQSEKALEDVKLMLYLADSLKGEPFLISHLVRLACLQLGVRTAWEGLAEHRWSEAQLQELQGRFQQYDLLADVQLPLATERAAGVLTADLLARGKYNLSDLGDSGTQHSSGGTGLPGLISKFIPRGWYYLEQLNYCRLYQMQLGGTFDAGKKRVFPDRIQSNFHELEREFGPPQLGTLLHHRVVGALLLPALGNVIRNTSRAQTAIDQAAIACALERYRLARGQFPEKLDSLAPQFISHLPTDILADGPYKYRRTDDGQFVLNSVGWDEKDHGATHGEIPSEDKARVWVWQYP